MVDFVTEHGILVGYHMNQVPSIKLQTGSLFIKALVFGTVVANEGDLNDEVALLKGKTNRTVLPHTIMKSNEEIMNKMTQIETDQLTNTRLANIQHDPIRWGISARYTRFYIDSSNQMTNETFFFSFPLLSFFFLLFLSVLIVFGFGFELNPKLHLSNYPPQARS